MYRFGLCSVGSFIVFLISGIVEEGPGVRMDNVYDY
jgi:hypothetical protein